jgi:alpha-glucoside transport system permease protein
VSIEAVAAAEATAPKTGTAAVKAVRKSFSSPFASLVMIVLTLVWTLPTFGLLVTSVRPAGDVSDSGWWTVFWHPSVWKSLTLTNYNTVLFQSSFGSSDGLMPYVVNSLAISIPSTIFPLVIASMAAYCLAWVRFKGSDVIFFVIFALQVVPLQLALLPLQQLYTGSVHIGGTTVVPNLHLAGTYVPVWISHTMFALPLAVFLLHNFMSQLPKDLMEAAQVDGANHFRVFRTIVLPLAAPALASFAIFQFLWVWNDLLVTLTFAGGSAEVGSTTVRVAQLAGSFGHNWEVVTAGAFISMIIPLIVFFALQRYFVRGLLAGSVKG